MDVICCAYRCAHHHNHIQVLEDLNECHRGCFGWQGEATSSSGVSVDKAGAVTRKVVPQGDQTVLIGTSVDTFMSDGTESVASAVPETPPPALPPSDRTHTTTSSGSQFKPSTDVATTDIDFDAPLTFEKGAVDTGVESE